MFPLQYFRAASKENEPQLGRRPLVRDPRCWGTTSTTISPFAARWRPEPPGGTAGSISRCKDTYPWRARAHARLDLIEFLPTTTAPFTATMQAASLFLLASAPFAAADIVAGGGTECRWQPEAYASQGACMDATTGIVACPHAAGSSSASPLINTTCCQMPATPGLKSPTFTTRLLPLRLELRPLLETAAAGSLQLRRRERGKLQKCRDGQSDV